MAVSNKTSTSNADIETFLHIVNACVEATALAIPSTNNVRLGDVYQASMKCILLYVRPAYCGIRS